MKKWTFFILLVLLGTILFCSKTSHTYAYKLAICSTFKNEAPYLKEWIVYHHDVLGVDRFYLYNNDSADNYAEVLAPFIQKGIVELIDWKSTPDHYIDDYKLPSDPPQVGYQLGSLNDCLKKRAFKKAEWVAAIDIDEFIVPSHGITAFYTTLEKAAKDRIGTIRIFWRVFGTSEIYDLAPEALLTETMTFRAPDEHTWHKLCKSIHHPEGIQACMLHEAAKLKRKFRTKTMNPKECSIHHYWFRSEKFAAGKRGHTLESIRKAAQDFNQQKDLTMEQYLPALKKALSEE